VCVLWGLRRRLSADRRIGHVNSSDSLKAETILRGHFSGMETYAQTLMASSLLSPYPENCDTTAKDWGSTMCDSIFTYTIRW
jgi:hypothetical protein